MPIFDYRCDSCGHSFDILQKLGADPLTDCPECGEASLKKLLSAPAFHLKGKGWRNSDDAPKKPNVRPGQMVHTFDSAQPHAEHTHEAPAKPADGHGAKHDHSHGHGHSHSHGDGEKEKGGLGKLVRDHVHSHSHGHSHSHEKSHGHSHDHGKGSHKGHKHD